MFFGKDCGNALAAVDLYVHTFPMARVVASKSLPGSSDARPLNQLEILTDQGRSIAFDSDLDHNFTPTPAMSVWLDLESEESLRSVASDISDGGRVLMPANNYGFSELFALVEDRFGFSWELNL
jgi:predicted 3-demethylubiquinone-9 3-methyltransferase (glyoxalase superfamily)